MKQSTLILKGAVVFLGLPVLILGGIGIPWLFKNPANPDYDQVLYPIIAGLYLSVLPYFYALKQVYAVLKYIELNEAFSVKAVIFLKRIKYSTIIFSGIYLVILPFVFGLAQIDDAPGLVLVGALPIFASFVLTVFVAVLQELLENAIAIKEENELTI